VSGSRRKSGPLGPFVDGYRAWLVGRGYSPSVVVRSLVALGHLRRWLQRNALAVDRLTARAVSSFLGEYRVDRGRLPGASAWPLLEYLRAEGAVPPEPPAVVAPVEQLVGEYREWLVCECGLAPVTVRGSERLAAVPRRTRLRGGSVRRAGDHGRRNQRFPGARVRAGEQRLRRVLHLGVCGRGLDAAGEVGRVPGRSRLPQTSAPMAKMPAAHQNAVV
jgi:hypothetical protein